MKKILFSALAFLLVSCGNMLKDIEKNAANNRLIGKSAINHERRAQAAALINKYDEIAQNAEWNWDKKDEWNRAKEIVQSSSHNAESVNEAVNRIFSQKEELVTKEKEILEQDIFKAVKIFYVYGINVKDRPKDDDEEGRKKYFYERYLQLKGTVKDGWSGEFTAKGDSYGFLIYSNHPKDRFGRWEFKGFDGTSLKDKKKFNSSAEEIALQAVNKTTGGTIIVSSLTDGKKYRMTLKKKVGEKNSYTLKLEEA